MLYQLSYSREVLETGGVTARLPDLHGDVPFGCCLPAYHGGEGNRTPDLVNAIHALSQLSYAPVILGAREAVRSKQGKLPSRFWGVKRIGEPSVGFRVWERACTAKFGANHASVEPTRTYNLPGRLAQTI